jgi:hypothetical protein
VTHLFTIGHPATVTSGGRANTIRDNEGAVVSAERAPHLTLDDVGWGTEDWTFEGWVEIDRWMKTGGAWSTMAALAGANAEILFLNNAGTLSFRTRTWLENPTTLVATSYDSALVAATTAANGTPHLLTLQFETAARRICAWLDGVVAIAATGLGSSGDVLHHKRNYVGAIVNTSGADMTVDTGATPGLVALDNLRFSKSARYTYNTGFTAPSVPFADTGAPAAFVWPLREDSLPYFAQSTFGDEWGILRLSAHADRWAGPWALTPDGGTDPFP